MSIFRTTFSMFHQTFLLVMGLCLLFSLLTGCHKTASQKEPVPTSPAKRTDIPEITIAQIGQVFANYEFPKGDRSKPGLVIIGLDGFSLPRMQDMMKAGKLPVLEKLASTSAWGKLQSTVIPSSVVAWTSAFTGQLPRRHGMTSFFTVRQDGLLGLINSRYRTRKAIWDYFSDNERLSVIMNIPGTYPVDPIRGIAVSCLLTPPGENFTQPPGLTDYLRRLSYYTSIKPLKKIARPGTSFFDPASMTLDVDQVFTITYNQAKTGLFLFERVQPDLFIIVFTLPDRLQHSLHILPENIITEAYRNFDTIVGHFLARKPADSSVIMLSDHGFKSYRKAFFPNKWLQQQGWLTIRDESIILEESRVITVDTVGNFMTFRINVQGRDRYGMVPPGQTGSFFVELEKSLSGIVSPLDKKHIVLNVSRFSLETNDDYAYTADVVVELDPEYMAIPALNSPRPILSLEPPLFDHERDGFFLVNGPDITPGTFEATIPDITPLALYLSDYPIPEDIDGRLLKELIKPDRLVTKPPVYAPLDTRRKFTPGPDGSAPNKEVMDFLRSLGYTQ